jgi:acetylornithine deacetylase/succinyl-diaminopimelate desuccinylase-like protein
MLGGGHAVNALPQTARAVVNCRMMPSEKVDDVKATLVRVLGDDHISVTLVASCSLARTYTTPEVRGIRIQCVGRSLATRLVGSPYS